MVILYATKAPDNFFVFRLVFMRTGIAVNTVFDGQYKMYKIDRAAQSLVPPVRATRKHTHTHQEDLQGLDRQILSIMVALGAISCWNCQGLHSRLATFLFGKLGIGPIHVIII